MRRLCWYGADDMLRGATAAAAPEGAAAAPRGRGASGGRRDQFGNSASPSESWSPFAMLKGADRRLKKLTDHRLLVGGGRWESDKQRHYAEWAWKALGAALTEVREEAVRMLREDHPSKAVAPDLLRKRDDARQDALPKLKRSIDETARATHASNGWRGGAPRQESLATACERAKLLDTAEHVNISEELRNLEELRAEKGCLLLAGRGNSCALRIAQLRSANYELENSEDNEDGNPDEETTRR